MKKSLLKNRLFKTSHIVGIVVGGICIAFATWLVMRVATVSGELEFTITYELPEFSNLENMYSLNTGSYAVAVNGETVSGKKSREVRSTASMAKMILGLAIMREKPFSAGEKGEIITIDASGRELYENYAANGGSVSEVEEGEEISEYDALVSVFLPSSNNMADTLAIWAFGSLDDYYEYATDMLKDLGVYNTTIGEDASGFDPSTTSTASDMAKIAMYVMKDPVLKEIVALKEYEVPVAGVLKNTNALLGQNNISGVKTGYIGEPSGYCLASGYIEGDYIITAVLMGASSREESFDDSLGIINAAQEKLPLTKLVAAGDTVGYYDSWWTGKVPITANEDIYGIGWADAPQDVTMEMSGQDGILKITIGTQERTTNVSAAEYNEQPNLIDIIRHVFGWKNEAGGELGNEA